MSSFIHSSRFALLLIVLAFLTVSNVQANNCQWVSPKGNKFDLNGLKTSKGLQATGDGKSYYVGFCESITPPNSACQGSSRVFQVDTSASPNLCYLLSQGGDAGMTVALLDPTNENGGLVVEYQQVTGGDGYGRGTRLDIYCGKSQSALQYVTENKMSGYSLYEFKMTSPRACVGGGGSSGRHCALGCFFGVGGLLMVLAVVALVLYFVIGTIVGKFVQKKEGIEIVPQVHFWKDIPFLLKDGVMLFVDLFRSVTKKGGYEEVSS